jgi:hypothetical protein
MNENWHLNRLSNILTVWHSEVILVTDTFKLVTPIFVILLIIFTMAWSIVFAGLQSVCISDSANSNNGRPTILNMNVRNTMYVHTFLQ